MTFGFAEAENRRMKKTSQRSDIKSRDFVIYYHLIIWYEF